MAASLGRLLARWAETLAIPRGHLPAPGMLEGLEEETGRAGAVRTGVEADELASWEGRHGFRLPEALRAWLRLSDGLYTRHGPLVHPLRSIGPMIAFARMPELAVQPEGWYELGNPGAETVCIDLALAEGDGEAPVFTSGDDERQTRPRIIAPSFEAWFLQVLREGGRVYWFDPGFRYLGDPWEEHCLRAPAPPLPERLQPLATQVEPLMRQGADDLTVARELGITRHEAEILFRHLQHAPPRAVTGSSGG